MTSRREFRARFPSGTPPEEVARVFSASLRQGYREWAQHAEQMIVTAYALTDEDRRDLICLVQLPDSALPFDAIACMLPEHAGPVAADSIADAIETTAREQKQGGRRHIR